ncbi:MAG: hypothetical protein MAG451_01215 [Anaerolineales bacterium]|nr:hypothetical protein [Anaerolineales bacterium]
MPNHEVSQAKPSFDWAFWFRWILVNTLGWLLGWTLLHQTGIGAVIGLTQWFVLRSLAPQAGWWVLLSAGGWAIGQVVVITVLPPQVGVLAGAVLGATTGIAQWLVLRRWVHRAGWWIVMSILGWALGLTGVLGASLVGAVAGGVTGFALELLLRHPRS